MLEQVATALVVAEVVVGQLAAVGGQFEVLVGAVSRPERHVGIGRAALVDQRAEQRQGPGPRLSTSSITRVSWWALPHS